MDHKHAISTKLRAFVADLMPIAVFMVTLITSVIIALAAGIIYRTATKSLHVNINKVDTASIDLNGSLDLGGIELGVSRVVARQMFMPDVLFLRNRVRWFSGWNSTVKMYRNKKIQSIFCVY